VAAEAGGWDVIVEGGTDRYGAAVQPARDVPLLIAHTFDYRIVSPCATVLTS
jgi:hypothetical protein